MLLKGFLLNLYTYHPAKTAARTFLCAIVFIVATSLLPTAAAADGSSNVDLTLGGGIDPVYFSVQDLYPGQSGISTITLQNTGSTDGGVTIWISDIVSSEGRNPESETGNIGEPGELADIIQFTLSSPLLVTDLEEGITLADFPQSFSDPDFLRIDPLEAGETATLLWEWDVPANAGNEIQGDSLTFTINFVLEEMAPECVTLYGKSILQGGERSYPGHNIPLTVNLYSPDTVITSANVLTESPLYSYSTVNETLAVVGIKTSTHTVTWIGPCIPPGTYNITISSPHTLINLKENVELHYEGTLIHMGTLIEGNSNNDTRISGSDLSMLLNDYLAEPGDENWNEGRCDFDRNGIVDSIDFSILAMNYGKTAPQNVQN